MCKLDLTGANGRTFHDLLTFQIRLEVNRSFHSQSQLQSDFLFLSLDAYRRGYVFIWRGCVENESKRKILLNYIQQSLHLRTSFSFTSSLTSWQRFSTNNQLNGLSYHDIAHLFNSFVQIFRCTDYSCRTCMQG